MFRYSKYLPFLLFLVLFSCKSSSDYSAFENLFRDEKGGDFRGFSLGMDKSEIEGQEIFEMESDGPYLLSLEVMLKEEGASLENSALIEYNFNEQNKLDHIYASILLEDKKMENQLKEDVLAHFKKLHGESISGVESYPSWIWEAKGKTVVFAEPRSKYETFTLDFFLD